MVKRVIISLAFSVYMGIADGNSASLALGEYAQTLINPGIC